MPTDGNSLEKKLFRRRWIHPARRAIKRRLVRLREGLRPPDYGDVKKRVRRLEENQRKTLLGMYRDLAAEVDQREALAAAEFRLDTENGEAGLLLWMFSRLGLTDRRAVEFGIGRIGKCNSTNLVRSFGWSVLLMDGDPDRVEKALEFYREHSRADIARVRAIETLVTPENVDELIEKNGFGGEIDLLSIDVDGNDYWIWEAIERSRPRVVIIEYNASFGPDEAVVTEYYEAFDRYALHPLGWYYGASLAALEGLGRRKGYVLVGCETAGHNAFFVRTDVLQGRLHALGVREAFYPDQRRTNIATQEKQQASLAELPVVRVPGTRGRPGRT